jgi:alkanesulfonate monooxygenase SsuD/methylene tetrahydromethanopterin reductase-like flavin-dependent oxidoreductase (luciferase family)
MDYGVHLPLIDFEGRGHDVQGLLEYTRVADELGYAAVTANDHLVFSRPWLDGPTALAAVAPVSGEMTLATTIILIAVRGPVTVAKALGAIDVMSGGRLIVAVGPGSSARDYEAVGVPWEERWKRLSEGARALRSLWAGEKAFEGRFYAWDGLKLEPEPIQRPSPPIWIGSWGSEAGLKRTARIGDGWLASAYNTTPTEFAAGLQLFNGYLASEGKDPKMFPNGLATMWFHVTEDKSERHRVYNEVLQPMLNRPLEVLEDRLCIGSAEECAEKLRALAGAGVQRVYIWPLSDPVGQIERFREKVVPLVG